MTAGQTPPSTPAEQLADRAYFGLRDRIVDLRLPPGSTLREDGLTLETGLGRPTLREAGKRPPRRPLERVRRLALEHLVEVRPRRGTMVTDVHAEDIARFAEVRAELEPHAARL